MSYKSRVITLSLFLWKTDARKERIIFLAQDLQEYLYLYT